MPQITIWDCYANENDNIHYIWGSDGNLNFGNAPEPKTFYTW
jgi:hypothetical protein